jgi:hypothetical protein
MSTAAVWQVSDTDLLDELAALETRLRSTWAEMLKVVAEVDSRGTAETVGYRSTVDLVRAVGRVSRGEARARVAAAADVLPDRGLGGVPVPPRLPATAAAVAEHAIGPADVTVIRSVLARIPAHVDDHHRAEVEAELAKHSRTLDAAQLSLLGTRILAHLDQDGPPPKDDPETRRRLTFTDRDGGYELGGWLDREAAEILRSALSPLAAPRPTTDTPKSICAPRPTATLMPWSNSPNARSMPVTYPPKVGNARRSWSPCPWPCSKAGSGRPRWRWVARSMRTSPAGSPVTRGSSRSCSVPGVSHWTSADPATQYPPRSAAR